MQYPLTILAAIACYLVSAIVPAIYLGGIKTMTIWGVVWSLPKLAPFLLMAYVGLNIASGLYGQRNRTLYNVDYAASWVAMFSFTITTIIFAVGLVQANTDFRNVMNLPLATWLLGGFVSFSWIDVIVLQGNKHETMLVDVNARRAAPAPPVAPAVAPAPHRAGQIVAILLLLVVMWGLILVVNTDWGEGTPLVAERARSCPSVSEFLGKNTEGVDVYVLRQETNCGN